MDLRPPVATMVARPVAELPGEAHGDASFEPKLDGWRCLAFHCLGGRVDRRSIRDAVARPLQADHRAA